MDTGLLDSHVMFGINAPQHDRVNLRKFVTCSPIHIKDLAKEYNNTNNDFLQFYLGEVVGVSDYTYFYNVHTPLDSVGYHLV